MVLCGKKRIIDVENVIGEKEYDHFDKIPKLMEKKINISRWKLAIGEIGSFLIAYLLYDVFSFAKVGNGTH